MPPHRHVTIQKHLGPEGRIAVVRLDRGDQINALSPAVMRELKAAALAFEDDVATSVVILTGSRPASTSRTRRGNRGRPWGWASGARRCRLPAA